MANIRQVLLKGLLVLSSMVIGLAVGTIMGARCCVAPGSGMAGPVIAIGYGVMGAVALGAIAFLFARKLNPAYLIRLTVPVTVIGSVLFGLMLTGYFKSREENAQHLAEAYANMNRFWVKMAWLDKDGQADFFQSAEFDWHAATYSVQYHDRRCAAVPEGPHAVAMLTALREAEGVVYRDPKPCAGSEGRVVATLRYEITEAMPHNNSADLKLTEQCLRQHPGLRMPFAAMRELAAQNPLQVKCQEKPGTDHG